MLLDRSASTFSLESHLYLNKQREESSFVDKSPPFKEPDCEVIKMKEIKEGRNFK